MHGRTDRQRELKTICPPFYGRRHNKLHFHVNITCVMWENGSCNPSRVSNHVYFLELYCQRWFTPNSDSTILRSRDTLTPRVLGTHRVDVVPVSTQGSLKQTIACSIKSLWNFGVKQQKKWFAFWHRTTTHNKLWIFRKISSWYFGEEFYIYLNKDHIGQRKKAKQMPQFHNRQFNKLKITTFL